MTKLLSMPIYNRLYAQMRLKGFSVGTLAQKAHMGYESMRVKLLGERGFSLEEAIRIKQALAFQGTLEMLFEQNGGREET